MKSKRTMIPAALQEKALKKLYLNHTGIEKTRMLACKPIYWANMNAYIEEIIKNCPTCLDSRQHNENIKQCHKKYKGGCGNLQQLTSL